MTNARPNRGTALGLVTAAILGITIISQQTLAHAAHGGGGFHGGGFHGGGFHRGEFHGGYHGWRGRGYGWSGWGYNPYIYSPAFGYWY